METLFKRFFAGSLMLAFAVLFISNTVHGQNDSELDTQQKTVYEVVNANDNTSEFATLLDKSGYGRILKQPESTFTVLAPSNEAVQNADTKLKASPKKLMQGQIFQGEVTKDQVETQTGVTVQETDKSAANGVVYIVDTVVTQ
ncbi:fasciclin domain-containing protein [Aliifodinibius sp. S!AR15-10]|uniref:fasciclin domain-containing protein n=1 Tax=Aliifodinibius sp. S!AR15-10 TaxID=2950437 RepID=UPI00285A6FDA|nr:fasciclin domain-containing protein [Aliifodinibius sp. S!AR15-10]MDR8393952.1 fasciclin domain-containing protein [Aliifodinibius sp. S!AR15-10]